MKLARLVAAAVGATTVLGATALAAAARSDDDPSMRQNASEATTYEEPAGDRLRDGTYVGYVHLTGDPAGTLSVDVVSLDEGGPRNTRPEVVVDGGPLVDADLFDQLARPFRVVIDDGTLVGAHATDELPDTRIPLEGLDLADKLAAAVTDAFARDAARYSDEDDAAWWSFEKNLLRAVIATFQ